MLYDIRCVGQVLLQCVLAMGMALGGATLAQANTPENRQQAQAELAILETTVIDCYRAKDQAASAGRSPSGVRCFDDGNATIFTTYRKVLRRLGLFRASDTDIRDGYSALISSAYACRARQDNVIPPLAEQELCATAAFDLFAAVLGGTPPPPPSDTTPPDIVILQPSTGSVFDDANITVSGSISDTESAIAAATINGTPLMLDGESFSVAFTLNEGSNQIDISATDTADNTSSSTITVTLRTQPPSDDPEEVKELGILEGQVLACLTEHGADATTAATASCLKPNGRSIYANYRRTLRQLGLFNATVRAAYITLRGDVLSCIALIDGTRPPVATQLACAADAFDLFQAVVAPGSGGGDPDTTPPVLAIDSPADGTLTTTPDIVVSGEVSDSQSAIASVTVNGTPASVTDGTFSAPLVLSAQGSNALTVVASDAQGNQSTASRTVILDSLPPEIDVLSPPADSVTSATTVELQTQLTDSGTGVTSFSINGTQTTLPEPTAQVTDTTAVSLSPGANTIDFSATDAAGNSATGSIVVISDTTAPELEILTPADGAVLSVARVTVSARASDPESGIESVSINGTEATRDGDAYNGFIDLAPGANQITVAATNAAGLVQTDTINVTFTANSDSTPPLIDSTYPLASATDVHLSSLILVRFSEPMDAASISATTLAASTPNGAISGSTALSEDGLTAVFRSDTTLPANSVVSVSVSGVRDIAGNELQDPLTLNFTTGEEDASEDFEVVGSNIASNSTDIGTNASIRMQFNRRVNPASLIQQHWSVTDSEGLVIEGQIQVDAMGMRAAFVPARPLPVGRRISMFLSNSIESVEREPLDRFSLSFEVGYQEDNEAPQVLAYSPANPDTPVPLNTQLSILLSESISAINLQQLIQVSINGTPITGSIALSDANRRVTFTPTTLLTPNTTYQATLAGVAEDASGNQLSAATMFQFTTSSVEDTTRPEVDFTNPASSNFATPEVPVDVRPRIHFNEPIDATTIGSIILRRASQFQALPASVSQSEDGKIVSLVPNEPLVIGEEYRISIAAELRDLAGNTLCCFSSRNFRIIDQTNPPELTTSLANLDGVPRNARLSVNLNRVVDLASVNDQTLQILQNGVPISGTFTISQNAQGITFQPDSLLAASTTYTLEINGLVDTAGNAFEPLSGSFSTGTAQDTTRPSLISSTPATGASDVSPFTLLTLRFDDQIEPSSIAISTLSITKDGNTTVQVPVDVEVNGNSVSIRFLEPLPPNSELSLRLPQASNITGASTFFGQTLSFSTGGTSDQTPPQLLSSSPRDNSVGVSTQADISLMFSESIDPESISRETVALFVNGEDTDFSFRQASDSSVINISAFFDWPENARIELAAIGLRDLAGNEAGQVQTAFETGPRTSTSTASVIETRPRRGAVDVSELERISLVFSAPMNLQSVAGALRVAADGVLLNGNVSSESATSAALSVVEFTPDQPLPTDALITVNLLDTARTLRGTPVQSTDFSYRTINMGVSERPRILNVDPLSIQGGVPTNALIAVRFSESIDPDSLTAGTITLTNSSTGETITAVASLTDNGQLLRLTPSTLLQPDTNYLLRLTNQLTDLQGERVSSNSESTTILFRGFRTSDSQDSTSGNVVAASPVANASNVPENTLIRLRISEPLSLTALSARNFELRSESGEQIRLNFSVESNAPIIELTPESFLKPGQRYTLDTQGLLDSAGNTIDSFSSSFLVTEEFARGFSDFALSPAQNATEVPTNSPVQIVFDRQIDRTSLTDQVFSARTQGGIFRNLAVQFSLASDETTLTVIPEQAWPVGQRVRVSASVHDYAGNRTSVSANFTASFSADSTTPQIVSLVPADGSSGVALNQSVSVRFSEAISATSAQSVTLSNDGEQWPVAVSFFEGNTVMRVTAQRLLRANSVYFLDINGLQDLTGNPLPRSLTGFVTAGAVDIQHPSVRSASVADDAEAVPLTPTIRVLFSESVAAETINSNTLTLRDLTSGQVPVTVSLDPSGTLATVTPNRPLRPNTEHNFQVNRSVTDVAGNPLNLFFSRDFTTQAGTSQVPAVRVNSNIESGASVPINATLRLSYNQPLDTLSLLAGGISLETGSSLVNIDVQLLDDNTLEIDPATDLIAGQTYILRLQNLTDLSRAPLAAESLQFTTSADGVADTQGPELISQSPTDGATNVPVNSVISLVFNEDIDPTSVTDRSVELSVTRQPPLFESNEILADIEVAGSTVTLRPRSPLPGDTEIEVDVSQLFDLAGNQQGFVPRASFTTAADFETTPPELVLVQPNSELSPISPDQEIMLVFSESLKAASINNESIRFFVNGEPVSTFIRRMADNSAFTIDHFRFPAGASVQLSLSEKLEDLSGNRFQATTLSWQVTTAAQNAQTSVVLQRPANGSNQQDALSEILLLTDAPIDPNSARNAFRVSEDGILKTGTVQIQNGNQGLLFVPDAPFTDNAIVEIFLDSTALDHTGEPMRAYRGNFRVAPNPADTGLSLIGTSLNGFFSGNPTNLVIDLRFNKPLDPMTVNAAGVTLLSQGSQQQVAATVQLIDGGSVVRIQPTDDLSANTEYTIELNALMDGVGNGYTGSISFATEDGPDLAAPETPVATPRDGQPNVPLNAEIQIALEADISLITALTDRVQLVHTASGIVQPYTSSLAQGSSSTGQLLTLLPNRALEPNSLYEIRIQGLTDHALNPVPSSTSQFTTAAGVDLTRPVLIEFAPTGNNAPVNSVIALHFSETLAQAPSWQSPVTVRDSVTGQSLPGRVEQGVDGRQIRFIPESAYAVGRDIEVRWNVRDLAGNTSSGFQRFETSFNSDSAAPELLDRAPMTEAMNLPINSRLTLKFDEPVSPTSAAGLTLQSGAEVVELEVLEEGMGSVLVLRPTRLLSPNTTYGYAFQSISDLAGNLASSIAGTFTTGSDIDLEGIELITTSLPLDTDVPLPIDLSITLQFSEPLQPATIAEDSFTLFGPGTVTNGTLIGSGDTWVFTPTVPLQPDTDYFLSYSGVITDEAGNGLRVTASNTRFVTGDSLAGEVAEVSETSLNGQASVSVNSPLAINLSMAIDRTSLNSSSVVVQGPNGSIEGQIELDRRSRQLLFTPTAELPAGSNFTFQVSGLLDLQGRLVPESSGSFSTRPSTDPDNTPPTLIQSTPSGTGVSPTTSIVLTYSEILAPTSVGTDSITVSTSQFPQTVFDIDYVLQGDTIIITPTDALPDETEIRVRAEVRDLAGNRRSVFSAALFTTASGSDTQPPTLLSSSPADGSTNAQGNNGVTLMFSEPMNPALLTRDNIQVFRSGERVFSSISISSDSRVVRLPSIASNSSYQLLLSDSLEDLSGNPFEQTRLSFSTGPSDSGVPQVVDQRPAPGATEVDGNTPVSLFLSKPLDGDTLAGAFLVSQNGVLVSGTRTLNNTGTVALFTPIEPFADNALIEVFLTEDAQGTNGEPSRSYRGLFRTRTVNTNTPTSAIKASFLTGGNASLPVNADLEIEFSAPIATASLSDAEVTLIQIGGGPIDTIVSLNDARRVLSVTPTNGLAPLTEYQLVVSNLQADDGNGVRDFFGLFQTQSDEDIQAPQVLAVSPNESSEGAPLNTRLAIRLNEEINPISVTEQNIRLVDDNNNAVRTSMSFEANNTIIDLVPLNALNSLENYRLVVEGLRDVAGNPLADTVVTPFHTSANVETNRLSVIELSPARDDEVPVNATISYLFNQPLQTAKLSGTSIELRNTSNFAEVITGTVSTGLANTLVIFTPDTNLQPASSYQVRTGSGGVEGLSGNQVRFSDSRRFTTSSDVDIEPPTIVATSPASGATSVPINLRQIRLNTDEPIRSVADLSVTLSSATSIVPVEVSFDFGNQQLRIELTSILDAQTAYSLELSGLTDIAGNSAGPVRVDFTTSNELDTESPMILNALPDDDATGVPLDTSIEWTISEPLALPSDDSALLSITNREDFSRVALTTTFSEDGQTITATPNEPLQPGSEYEVSVNFSGSSLVDYAGNGLGIRRYSFTTAP